MTTLLDKSTPVPEVKVFHLPNLTPKAHAYRGKSLNENHPYQSGIGGREVGNPKSGFIQKNYASGVNRNHTLSRSRYNLKVESSPHEHRLTMPYGKVKEARYLSIWPSPQTENLSPGSWHPPDRRSPHTLWPKTTKYHSSATPVCEHHFTSVHFQELIL